MISAQPEQMTLTDIFATDSPYGYQGLVGLEGRPPFWEGTSDTKGACNFKIVSLLLIFWLTIGYKAGLLVTWRAVLTLLMLKPKVSVFESVD